MNINRIGSGDTIDVLSTLKSPVKQQAQDPVKISNKDTEDVQAKLGSSTKTDSDRLKKTDSTVQDKQKDDDKQRTSMQDANKMVEELNEYMDELQTSLGFSVTRDPANKVIFQIKDRSTDEVIKQIPSEEIQKIKEKMDELTGMLLDQHA